MVNFLFHIETYMYVSLVKVLFQTEAYLLGLKKNNKIKHFTYINR